MAMNSMDWWSPVASPGQQVALAATKELNRGLGKVLVAA
jgi:hypothetical protein